MRENEKGRQVDIHQIEIEQLISRAFTHMMRIYTALLLDGAFEHRGPFHLKTTVELNGQDPVGWEQWVDGPPEKWEVPFDRIADSKHTISQRLGRDTVYVLLAEREVGDTQYWGSVVLEFEGGRIVVAISGLQPWFDEALSGVFARILLGLLKNEEQVPRGPEPDRSQPPFLTEEWLEEIKQAA
jgi:hypothetical protein